ncbi:hypothetical protein FRC03_004226, partial [Tulasnella sp. 419]
MADDEPAVEEPMFDPSLKKKKKKKAVAFNEDQQAAEGAVEEDAQPTPAPAPGRSILKPSTSEPLPEGIEGAGEDGEKKADDDFAAMFGDVKKKKKKKAEIPLDLDGDAAPAATEAA